MTWPHRGAHERVDRGRSPVRAQREVQRRCARRSSRRRASPTRSRSSTTCAAAHKANGLPAPKIRRHQHGPFIDLCRGPHVESTGKIGPFKLLAVAGAYWRGDQKRPALQRIYGTVWSTQEELDHFLWRRERSEEARPPASGRAARPVLLPRRLAGRGVLAPEGLDALQHAARRHARASRRSAATRRSTRRRWSIKSCGSSRATGTCIARTCSWSRPRSRRSTASSR